MNDADKALAAELLRQTPWRRRQAPRAEIH